MKVWLCTCYDKDLGKLLSWWTSRRAATKHLQSFQEERGTDAQGPEGVEQVEIPTNKTGLIKWLNDNFTSDNG